MNHKATDKYHQELLNELKKHIKKGTKRQLERASLYLGTEKFYYNLKLPIIINIVKKWVKKHTTLSYSEYVKLLDSLYSARSHEEFLTAGKLIRFLPRLRKQLDPSLLERWLNRAEGWAEVDSICQSNFSAEEILQNFNNWESLINKLANSKNLHKKRASLVLLTGPVRHSKDIRLLKLAFKIIEKLKSEKDILITKAISWLLRALTSYHRKYVEEYIIKNSNLLPKTTIKEVTTKLKTGKKA